MARDHFAALGLTPGRYDPREIAARFAVRRARLTGELLDPATHDESRRRLEELHMAFAVLREPGRQEEYLRSQATSADRVAVLRQLIAASLEEIGRAHV